VGKDVAKSERTELLFSEIYPEGLGCVGCVDHTVCGGINTPGLFDCWPLCCNKPHTCAFICPRDVERFVEYVRNINGFEFDNIPLVNSPQLPPLPDSVPLIYHGSSRENPMNEKFVAVELEKLVNFRTSNIRFSTPEELSRSLGFNTTAKIVVSGVMDDIPLEKYWFLKDRLQFIKQLRRLSPALVTSPNFSSFANAPRWDNLFNLKRSLICWSEMISEGIPTALHINARTLRDWERVTEFALNHAELKSIAFEFATVMPHRKEWYVKRLVAFATNTNRKMQLVLRGGLPHLKTLKKSFNELTMIDTDSFIKAIYRQRMTAANRNESFPTKDVEKLFSENVAKKAAIVESALGIPKKRIGP
jgi:hypothetical protein